MENKQLIELLSKTIANMTMAMPLLEEMEELKTKEAKLYKALDKMEAVIQHDESDIASWLPLEYDLQLTYGSKEVAFSPYLMELKQLIDEWTKDKIAKGK